MTKQTQYGSYVPFKIKRTFLFVFTKTDGFWGRWLKGYTHCILLEYLNDTTLIQFEPLLHGCSVGLIENFTKEIIEDHKDFKFVEVSVTPTQKNRLIGIKRCTCATFVQYIAGITLGCITAQGLYNKLTCSDAIWLRKKGILGVKIWDV